MKTIMIVLLAVAMAFAVIPMGVAGIGSAHAEGCLPSIGHCAPVAPPAPLESTCQGAFHFGPTAPVPMGTVGGAGAG